MDPGRKAGSGTAPGGVQPDDSGKSLSPSVHSLVCSKILPPRLGPKLKPNIDKTGEGLSSGGHQNGHNRGLKNLGLFNLHEGHLQGRDS